MNRPPGGGGGLGLLLDAQGGGGGGGGGIVVLRAGGDLTVNTGIDVGGGSGGTSTNGSGGAGAGGVIVLSAGNQVTATGLASNPGAVVGNGGAGSQGRIRWDSAMGTPTGSPTPVRGVSFAATTPLIVTHATDQLTWAGVPNEAFTINAVDQTGETHTGDNAMISAGGTVTDHVPWQPGFNTVCFVLAGGMKGQAEAETCVGIALVP
jgi:hypothetical protein